MWKKTLCLKLIWLLFNKGSSLWSDWIIEHRIGAKNFWSLPDTNTGSWTWRAILYLHRLAARFLHARLGNGKCISFWWDNWTPFGPLVHFFGDMGSRETCIPITATVHDACNALGWNVCGSRSPQSELLQIHLTNLSLPRLSVIDDRYCWKINAEDLRSFSSKKTWDAIRYREEEKPWTSNVWFKGSIPKHSFTMWLAHLDRLPTRSRMVSWGLDTSTSCCLCDLETACRDHLFITCDVSSSLWDMILRRPAPPTSDQGFGADVMHTPPLILDNHICLVTGLRSHERTAYCEISIHSYPYTFVYSSVHGEIKKGEHE
ncbi:hypothetical protein N665_0683s0010 [Sinapis alba]|nr:hypothetical protein N665_0683s0010 [Sinapis alba]